MDRNTMKFTSIGSEKNVYLTKVCLLNDDRRPNSNHRTRYEHKKLSFNVIDIESSEVDHEDAAIQVDRTKALYEVVESHKKSEDRIEVDKDTNACESSTNYPTVTSGDESEYSVDYETYISRPDNPNILKLTKMKWLTEEQEASPDSSSIPVSPITSTTNSVCSRESIGNINKMTISDKCLSTILRVDREHNMFGLSNITIDGSKLSRKIQRDDEKPVFPQTAIVQICCAQGCCKHKSNTDLPTSLKCAGCRGCCSDAFCTSCVESCGPPCDDLPCPISKKPCSPSKCFVDCTTCFGLKISLHKKPKYDPMPVELTPRSSCVLKKPFAARSCHHFPQCVPPSSCFPYLMPCFWPARAGAPCSVPARCFHNPPCPAPRKPRPPIASIPKQDVCPPTGKCEDNAKKTKCSNQSCPGNNPALKKEIEDRFGNKKANAT